MNQRLLVALFGLSLLVFNFSMLENMLSITDPTLPLFFQ